MAAADLANDRLGDPGEDLVDRVADVAMAKPDAVVDGDELDPLAGAERAIDLVDRRAWRRLLVGDRVGDVAQCRPGRDQAGENRLALWRRLRE